MRNERPKREEKEEEVVKVDPRQAVFLGGVVKADTIDTLNVGELPRIVFAGRSNVGKSSLLNALTGARVARVSGEPGKTREMNFFRWSLTRDEKDSILLVDLPGFGYAKVSHDLRRQWGGEITRWLKDDGHIALVVALVDGRHGFLDNDRELVDFLRTTGVPLLVAFTKMDKYKSRNQRRDAERNLAKESASLGIGQYVFVSATEREGVLPLFQALRDGLKR